MPSPRAATNGRLLAAILLLALAAPARAGSPTAEIRDLLARDGPATGTFGFYVADAATGEVLQAIAAEKPRIPASTMKLVTTAAALVELGPDHALVTEARAAAAPDGEGVLAGDLVILGGGDPTLSAACEAGDPEGKLEELARGLARRGLRRIEGDLVLDDSFFDREFVPAGWPSDQLDRSYCARSGALVAQRSCVRVVAEPGPAAGSPARIRLLPAAALSLENAMTTTANRSEHSVVLFIPPGTTTLHARGRVWSGSTGFPADLAVPDPTAWFGAVMKRVLVRTGISLAGEVVRGPGAAARAPVVLASVETPLRDVLLETNRDSVNVYADCLLKLLGAVRGGEGSFAAGAEVTKALAERAGVPRTELAQVDGSGLSREDAVSPRFLGRLLGRVYEGPHRIAFLETLAVAGTSGTLDRRMDDLGGDVRAKTGTIRGVSALAGYIRAKSGRVLAFAFLENDPAMSASASRAVQDRICRILHEGL